MVDFSVVLSEIRKARSARKRKKTSFYLSKLDKFEFEIFSLKKSGAKLVDIQFFLQKNGINVALSTISRWLKNHG